MKYCLFDGGDVVGPFTAEQLLHRPGFGAHSLVCPEEYSEEEAYWKEARFYQEFGFEPQPQPQAQTVASDPAEEVQADKFSKEMDKAMTELSSLNIGEEGSSLSADLPASVMQGSAEESRPETAPEKEPSKAKPQPAAPGKSADVNAPAAPAPAEKEPPRPAKPSISSLLMRESEEMKRQRVARAAVNEAEKQKKSGKLPSSSYAKNKTKAENKDKASQTDEQTQQEKDRQKQEDEKSFHAAIEKATHKTPSVSPIEEYFNTIKSGDLGNILGIPDPKENSDMNLARVLERQFEKTEPDLTDSKEQEMADPFDEFTVKEKGEELDESLFEPQPPAAPAAPAKPAEQPAAPAPEKAHEAQAEEKKEEPHKQQEQDKQQRQAEAQLPDLKSAEALPLAGQPAEEPKDAQDEQDTQPPVVQEMIVPEQEDDPNDKTVKTILEGKLKVDTLRQEIPEPIKKIPAEAIALPDPQDAPKIAKSEQVVKKQMPGKMKFLFLFLGLAVLLTGFYLNLTHTDAPADVLAQQEEQTPAPAPLLQDIPDARAAINALPEEKQDPVELAKEIVQHYQLDKGRGTVEEYLNKLYAKQLQSGYAAMWSAEPLHRNSYVVKYRLAKTRKEPIVYIFQADTAKKKLTGALNNITLDLVGKIS